MTEARNFTWQQKFTDVLNLCPDDEQMAVLTHAIVNYGTYGIEPEIADDFPLGTLFKALRSDIDNSIIGE